MSESENVSHETTTPAEAPAEPKWWIADGIPGPGDRPTWLPDKFKTAESMSKSYTELEKVHGHVPEEYDLTKSKYLDPAYGPLKDFADFAKQKRVPKEVVEKALETFDKYSSEFVDDGKAEIAKLGENAPQRLERVGNWLKANTTAEGFKAIASQLKTAESIKAFEELRTKTMTNTVSIPNGNDSATNNAPSVADIQQEMQSNLEKYKTDPKYRAEIQAKIERASQAAA